MHPTFWNSLISIDHNFGTKSPFDPKQKHYKGCICSFLLLCHNRKDASFLVTISVLVEELNFGIQAPYTPLSWLPSTSSWTKKSSFFPQTMCNMFHDNNLVAKFHRITRLNLRVILTETANGSITVCLFVCMKWSSKRNTLTTHLSMVISHYLARVYCKLIQGLFLINFYVVQKMSFLKTMHILHKSSFVIAIPSVIFFPAYTAKLFLTFYIYTLFDVI